jgi:hypothetical protein
MERFLTVSGKSAIALALVALLVNGPILIGYVWRAIRRERARPIYLGLEGPILCDAGALMALGLRHFRGKC